jgi:hypothetical protein
VLDNLRPEFSLSERWNDQGLIDEPERYFGDELLAGAMPIATQGCALQYWLVVSGPQSGEVWLDKRTDGEGVEPVCEADGKHATFGAWFARWLASACAKHGIS